MTEFEIKLLESGISLALVLFIKFILTLVIRSTSRKHIYNRDRVKVTNKITNLILFLLFLGATISIWGVDKSKLAVFLSSILTVLGVAFFAQWSILSNMTASLIMFFNHPVKIGDHVTVLDKEYSITGRISDIRIFFLIITTDAGETITIPSNVMIQKMVRKNEGEENRES